MVLSTGVPSLADNRYFLSQMSSDASWKGMASTSLCSSLTTLFMDGYLFPVVPDPFFRTNSPQKSEPEKRRPPDSRLCASQRDLARAAVRQTRHSSPRLSPTIKMSRHNILCWGRESRHVNTTRQETSLS